jgi:hypothetical protein
LGVQVALADPSESSSSGTRETAAAARALHFEFILKAGDGFGERSAAAVGHGERVVERMRARGSRILRVVAER